VYDHTDNDGHLLILNGNGALIKDIAFVDGQRTHAGSRGLAHGFGLREIPQPGA
jgi:hypothetical protein